MNTLTTKVYRFLPGGLERKWTKIVRSAVASQSGNCAQCCGVTVRQLCAVLWRHSRATVASAVASQSGNCAQCCGVTVRQLCADENNNYVPRLPFTKNLWLNLSVNIWLFLMLGCCKNIIIIYHDFLPSPRRGSHVKSDNTHNRQHTHLSPYTWHLRLGIQ